jgi:competence protein ComEC
MTGPELAVLDVGQGDAFVLHDPQSSTAILIDCPAGKASVPIDFLAQRNVLRLESLIVSHLHDDHYGGALDVLRQVPANEILVSLNIGVGQAHPKVVAFLREIKRVVATSGCQWSVPTRSRSTGSTPVLHHGPMSLTVLGPDERAQLDTAAGTNTNHASMIVRADLGTFTVLLGADAPPARWAMLVASDDVLQADVMVFPHHGAAFGTEGDVLRLLDRVRPKVIVLSVGAHNSYDHPNETTLRLLGSYAISNGARLVCTQLNRHCAPRTSQRGMCAGTIVVSATGDALSVATERLDHVSWIRSRIEAPHCVTPAAA